MALQKQLAHLNLTGGLQKKDDERLVIPSKLASADNLEFDDASTVVRRGGQFKMSLTSPVSPSVAEGYRVFPHKGNALLENSAGLHKVWGGGGSMPVAPPPVGAHASPSVFPRAGMTTSRIGAVDPKGTAIASGIPYYDGSVDCAVLGSLTCYVWETRDSTGYGRQAVRVVITDANGAHVYSSLITGGSADVIVKPRVVANASKFFIYYAQFASGATTFDIKVKTITSGITVSSANTVLTAITGSTTESPDPIIYDVAFSADLTLLALVTQIDNGTFEVEWRTVSPTDGYTVGDVNSFTAGAELTTITALVTKSATNYKVHAIYGFGTSTAYAAWMDVTAGTTGVETAVSSTIAGGSVVGRISAYEISTTQILIAADGLSTVGTGHKSILHLTRCSPTYTSQTEANCFSPWLIAGRIALCKSRLFLPMVFVSSNYQSTYYIVDLTSAMTNLGVAGTTGAYPHVVARMDYGEGAVNEDTWVSSTRNTTLAVVGNKLIFPFLKYETDLRIVGGLNETTVAVSSATIDFDSQLGHEEVNGLTWLAGACPQIWDGENLVEEGFHHAPEVLQTTLTAIAGGTYSFANATKDYTVCFTCAWQDAQGNWWESGPSNEVTLSVTAGSGFYTVTPPLVTPPSQKPNFQVIMYRTQGSSTDTSLYVATSNAGVSVTSDPNLITGEQLYTTGNILPNTPAPACRQVSLFQKRLVLAGCGDGSKIHWSKVSTPGFGVEFAADDPTHQVTVTPDKGRVVGTKELDDRMVVFCEKSVGVISGTGPAPTGLQGAYSDFATTVPDIGASWDSPKSLARSLGGIWFQTPFGLRFFTQGGSLGVGSDGKQLGSEVDSLVSGNIVALSNPTSQQVRFFQSSGTTLVYDYQWQQWTRFTGTANIDACLANGRLCYLSNVSSVAMIRYISQSVYTDVNDAGTSSSSFSGYLETPWLSFAGMQGFQRVYRLMVVGRNTDSSTQTLAITGTIGYDFETSSPPTSESFSSTVTPASGGLVQFQHHLARQKCESIKLGLSFNPTSTNTGRLRLTDLTLQVGIKPGYYKLPSSKRL